MGSKPSRTRDLMGAVLLVLVGILYMSGISTTSVERGVNANIETATDVVDVSLEVTSRTLSAWIG